ncbi:Flavonol synthase/flavanone 3-hydroxylase [Seminavis robusta]|uniref:Flavonol synthase/flavanone 3-hydroxylase n=1 Tax=Seminavis robusta TaxID=568900 RepID=A0A9N8DRC6_9STRA|nr:Flavonol synthase/flavanone 3-hydroxylase [Seminavis robusta]|eukprot:Sro296_g110790.1 Flavonol synthase/flavanone 3-hydroxylase (426) ;mRNA; f:74449-75726
MTMLQSSLHRLPLLWLFVVILISSALQAAEASTSSSSSSSTTSSSTPQPTGTALAKTSTVPVIDLSNPNDDELAQQIADACSTYGFFQVTSHGISVDLMTRFRHQCAQFFDLDATTKKALRRNSHNARGFFDDELTKQRRDWKECLDFGVPGSRLWDAADDSPFNACLDGFNQFPSVLPEFRPTMVEYFDACAKLSHRVACLMARGMGLPETDSFLQDLKHQHSSYLRLNYYPPCQQPSAAVTNEPDPTPLGISPHKDAGFLTVLLQDDECHSLQAFMDGQFVSVQPVPGAVTINTGDMAQIWSNGRYKAPLHRVLTDPTKKRYSAPFFYNPGYNWLVTPLPNDSSDMPKYFGCLWGYFRAVRFAGDLTNLGVEIQIDDYETQKQPPSAHLKRQKYFQEGRWTSLPFDVERYRVLIQEFPDEMSS